MNPAMRKFAKDVAERAAKTFVQAYLAFWLMRAGLAGDTVPDADAFDVLFTLDNAKAGVVGVALSVAFSFGSKRLGPDPNSASVVLRTDDP